MRHALVVALLLVGTSAHAFCGFFVAGSNKDLANDASKVVLMRKGNRTVLTMSNNYKGPPSSFALVVPVPVVLKKEEVKTLPADVFSHIDQLSAPRLVEYWEQDPCNPQRGYTKAGIGGGAPGAVMVWKKGGDTGVKVEARFSVGEYDIVILSAKEANGLETWLQQNHYSIPAGAAEALAPYVKSQMKFFVAKVDITKVKKDAQGTIVLSPLRFHYEAPALRLPVRLGLLNSKGKQDLIVYVLSPDKRYEVANYPNVFIPTNLEVIDDVKKSFASFYAQLFDATMAKHDNRAVVTEYAWQTSSCDPCPVPPLQPSDLATLGDDVLSGNNATAANQSKGDYYGDFSSWVLTRLHTRYAKETLSEDLVFRTASPIVGGRAGYDTQNMEAPGEAKPDSSNNFQARYIIRHAWKGKAACAKPEWGNWGGPPDGDPHVRAAQDLSSAPRNGMDLKKVVRSKLGALNLPGIETPRH
ncbi:MAG: DUF2330 domain-containing protein [Polyangia bacterium]